MIESRDKISAYYLVEYVVSVYTIYENIILYYHMATLSIPVPPDILLAMDALIQAGVAPNKAALVRDALQKYVEEKAVEAVIKASKEPTLQGDLDDLASKL